MSQEASVEALVGNKMSTLRNSSIDKRLTLGERTIPAMRILVENEASKLQK